MGARQRAVKPVPAHSAAHCTYRGEFDNEAGERRYVFACPSSKPTELPYELTCDVGGERPYCNCRERYPRKAGVLCGLEREAGEAMRLYWLGTFRAYSDDELCETARDYGIGDDAPEGELAPLDAALVDALVERGLLRESVRDTLVGCGCRH